ncbi:hypothetical protein SAMN05428949_6376 [Chitinophaga sp. YR627]|nr:hypothetical protein SAMN05428949_6376 [Chitinophaga sp. YR627]
MIIRIENNAQIIERLKKNGQCFIINSKEDAARRESFNKHMREVKRDLQRKLHLSQISAANLILTS